MTEHLSSAEVALELRCSRRHALDLMREMQFIDIGHGRLRVEREDFEQWRAERKSAAEMACGSGAALGGRISRAAASRQAVRIARLRVLSGHDLSEKRQIHLPQPRVRKRCAT